MFILLLLAYLIQQDFLILHLRRHNERGDSGLRAEKYSIVCIVYCNPSLVISKFGLLEIVQL